MKKITEIRSNIADIPGVFIELPSEEADRSNDPAIKTLWSPDRDDGNTSDYICQSDDELPKFPDLTGPEELFEYGAEIDKDELVRALGGVAGNQIKQAKLHSNGGLGALGWYIPFHVKNVNPGIYIPISSILFLVREYFWELETDFWTKFKLAFRAIHQHELFHFAVDYMAAQWEGITSSPCKFPGIIGLRSEKHGYILQEEELANTQMLFSFRWANKPLNIKGKTAALKKFVKNSKPGYCDALKNTKVAMFDKKCEMLALDYVAFIPGYEGQHLNAVNVNDLFLRFPRLDWRFCPIHILHDEKKYDLPLISLDLPHFPRRR